MRALLTVGLALLCAVSAGAVLLGDFESGDTVGWRLVGGSPYLAHYRVEAAHGHGGFCLRLTMSNNEGWCGVAAPAWRQPPVPRPTAITLAARGNAGAAEILVDVHQADGERWWSIWPLPRDGSWTAIRATPDRFFQVDKQTASKAPDFTKISAIWLSLRQSEARGAESNPAPAVMEIDDVALEGEAAPAAPSAAVRPPKGKVSARALAGVTVLVADTGGLSAWGQRPEAPMRAAEVLKQAGATVRMVAPGGLGNLPARPGTVLVWEGPTCREGDWPAVEAWLAQGGALVWWGAGLPFMRAVGADGEAGDPDQGPARAISQGVYQEMHALEAETGWSLTKAGRQVWPGLPRAMPAGTCRYLTTNDSIYLATHWPWVEVTPLVTLAYHATNWVSAQRDLTGAPVVIYRHHAGPWAGARLLVATVGRAGSLLDPDSPWFPFALVGAARAVAKPIAVNRALDALPPPPPPVTRANFFTHARLVGTLDWEATDWGAPDFPATVRRLGLNVLHTGVPWRRTPDAEGNLVDWETADRRVAQAEAGGWAVVFDPYCFGYGQFAWGTEGPDGPGTAAPASLHNPLFRQRFAAAMAALARRYAHRPSVVALFATPDTTVGGYGVEDTPVGRAAWAKWAAPYGVGPDPPKPHAKGTLDLSPARALYSEFLGYQYHAFMREVITAIRREAPDMPLLLRGSYLDAAACFRLAAEFPNVAPECECIETGIDVETYFRGFAERYRVPIIGENGWPKARGPALRMACATALLGGYRGLLFSFGGPEFARPGLSELRDLERVWEVMHADGLPALPRARIGLLIPDATIWASEPPNFLSAQDRPNITQVLERGGMPYDAVSAQWPRLRGLSVLMDDGRNDVLPAVSREAIASWVRAGGTLIAFPGTGRFDAAGGKKTLAGELGCRLVPGDYRVGRGRVIVLAEVPREPLGKAGKAVLAALDRAGCRPAVRVEPAVNQALFRRGTRQYLVLYNKSPRLVGAWFDEIRIPEIVSTLPDLRLTVSLPRGATAARELVTGRRLPVKHGRVQVDLPRTQWRVVEFE